MALRRLRRQQSLESVLITLHVIETTRSSYEAIERHHHETIKPGLGDPPPRYIRYPLRRK